MDKIGEICVREGFIKQAQLEEVLSLQSENKLPLGKILLESGYLTTEQFARALSIQLQIPYCRPVDLNLSPEVLAVLTPRQAERYRVIPVQVEGGRLTLATAEPLNLEGIDVLRRILDYKVIKLAVASADQITEALSKYYGASLESVAAVLEDLDEVGPQPIYFRCHERGQFHRFGNNGQ